MIGRAVIGVVRGLSRSVFFVGMVLILLVVAIAIAAGRLNGADPVRADN